MKNIVIKLLGVIMLGGMLSSCHKLDVTPTGQLPEAVFPQTEAQYQSIIGPVYIQLRAAYALDYFFVQSGSTDESILPAYGSNWYDGGKYMELHKHTWTKDNAWLNSVYSYAANLIGICNQTISLLGSAPEGNIKSGGIAQVKTVRALGYWMLLDMFGNVPLDTTYGVTTLHTNASRTEVFNFVESELKAALPYLSYAAGNAMYGKANRYVAWTLLAKMYLNAKVYTGTERNNDCIAACDSVINAGGGALYSLQPRSTYLAQFAPTNGPSTTPEFIFAIPFDPTTSTGYLFYARYDLNRNLGLKYRYAGSTVGNWTDPVIGQDAGNGLINSMPSGPRATLPEFWAYFNDTTDIRNQQWLSGYQYWSDGKPILIKTTRDKYFKGWAGDATPITYQLRIDPQIKMRNDANFDVGDDDSGWNAGVRNIKFLADYNNVTNRNQSNDAPFFRYSDVLLMKAEAILRGGTATGGQTALSLVNMVRAQRTTSAPLGSGELTLDWLYKERCREFAWECWHRNDMIRFDKFEDSYGFKTNKDTYRRIFPIPTNQFAVNGLLVQNTGYN
ncbi:Starch-binding associating with outer membrane [Filimonas lacunae]|uniref:Starch-binding associating with outer membrane n=1 Tax=Filimonas lacunae TaxID=477680 RepID=A0A1N7KSZ1_9BACT|nr:RagB/SusD family nutrient uptake outer membrane protein [Filimonas lacunae]SIS64616.1 Starch-binding associating with outer membrane [Filimonas lacunae]